MTGTQIPGGLGKHAGLAQQGGGGLFEASMAGQGRDGGCLRRGFLSGESLACILLSSRNIFRSRGLRTGPDGSLQALSGFLGDMPRP